MESQKGKSFNIDEEEISRISFNSEGLVPAIVQEESSGKVLMMAWMNEESLRETLSTGRTWFWSRSRQEYWCKGETPVIGNLFRTPFTTVIATRYFFQ